MLMGMLAGCSGDSTTAKTDMPYAFSAIPYTPQQISEACHVYELPTPCRTVVSIYGAMRGVGGIDSWGSNVEEAYHVASDRDISFTFRVDCEGEAMEHREKFTKESFWEEALKADSLLLWIIINSKPTYEG